ncbi:MAG: PIN domain-containing protein [Candidatus Woesebacteria bacterium]|nr:PIN domain-containing protein [Candidatus Woesebacteria bacterium]
MKLDKYSLDTHAIVWYLLKDKKLSKVAENSVRQVFDKKAIGIISVMVVLELYYVSLKDKKFDFSKTMELMKNANLKIINFDMRVLSKAVELPRGLDIHDRIIVATSILINSQLVTRDGILRNLFPNETIW